MKKLDVNFPIHSPDSWVVSLSSSKQIQEEYTLIHTRYKPFPAQHSNFRGKKKIRLNISKADEEGSISIKFAEHNYTTAGSYTNKRVSTEFKHEILCSS